MAEEVKAPELEKAEIPWVVAYLREDIQDLRNEVREVRRSLQRLDEKLDGGLTRLDARIDARTDGLDAKIDARTDGLDAKIEGLRREMNVQFRWLLGTMVAVGALIVAALKLLP
jgi:chromosome segregation ATPase